MSQEYDLCYRSYILNAAPRACQRLFFFDSLETRGHGPIWRQEKENGDEIRPYLSGYFGYVTLFARLNLSSSYHRPAFKTVQLAQIHAALVPRLPNWEQVS